jgi:hypothetical protein
MSSSFTLRISSDCLNLYPTVIRQELGIFLFTITFRQALGPTQPPIQWVPGPVSLVVKRAEREADHSLPSSAEFKNA